MSKYSFGNFTVEIDLVGAQLVSISYCDREYLHGGDGVYWGRSAPVLFPNVGRFVEDCYSYEGEIYHLSQHGFLRDQSFEFVGMSDNLVSFEFCSNKDVRFVYPFDFKFVVSYLFEDNCIVTSYEVINIGNNKMYYNVGAHPAFKIDLASSYRLVLDGVDKQLAMCPPYILKEVDNEGSSFDLEDGLFENDALIFEAVNHSEVVLYENDVALLSVSYDDAMFVGLWQPNLKGCPFVCIEPWWGVADYCGRLDNDLVNKPHVLELGIGASSVHSFKINFFRGV